MKDLHLFKALYSVHLYPLEIFFFFDEKLNLYFLLIIIPPPLSD